MIDRYQGMADPIRSRRERSAPASTCLGEVRLELARIRVCWASSTLRHMNQLVEQNADEMIIASGAPRDARAAHTDLPIIASANVGGDCIGMSNRCGAATPHASANPDIL